MKALEEMQRQSSLFIHTVDLSVCSEMSGQKAAVAL